jgi:hypothetical protein
MSIFAPLVFAAAAGLHVAGNPLDEPYVYEQPWEDDDLEKAAKSCAQLAELIDGGLQLHRDLAEGVYADNTPALATSSKVAQA